MKPNEIDFVKNGKVVLPQDYYCGLYILDDNLLVIYQRSISIIRNAFDGNPHEPDPEPFIEMQDDSGEHLLHLLCLRDKGRHPFRICIFYRGLERLRVGETFTYDAAHHDVDDFPEHSVLVNVNHIVPLLLP